MVAWLMVAWLMEGLVTFIGEWLLEAAWEGLKYAARALWRVPAPPVV